MRKFKIKNRKKRKYIKKADLAASFSHVHSLTLGIIPMLLMAIAFFTTFLISNPQAVVLPIKSIRLTMPTLPSLPVLPKVTLPQVAIPEITLPDIEINFDMPELPQLALPSFPQFTLPVVTIPIITIPNVMPSITASVIVLLHALDILIQTGIQGLTDSGNWLLATAGQVAIACDPRPLLISSGRVVLLMTEQAGNATAYGFTTAGQFIAYSASAVWTAVVNVSLLMVHAITTFVQVSIDISVHIATMVTQFISHLVQLVVASLQAAVFGVVNAWNGFIWFIGTPFRALGHAMDETAIVMTPFFNFISYSLGKATDELRSGGNTLIQSTNYVTSSVSTQK